eukprot:662072-Prymnesium_polylepis.1
MQLWSSPQKQSGGQCQVREGGHPQHPKGPDDPFIVVETKNSKRKESEGQGKRGGKRAIHSTRAPQTPTATIDA